MAAEFRMPSITGRDPEEKIGQLVSFLRQHIDQLTWTINNLHFGEEQSKEELANPRRLFASVKQLIAESKEIAEAHYRTAMPELDERYLKTEDFQSFEDELEQYKESTEEKIGNVIRKAESIGYEAAWEILRYEDKTEMWGMIPSKSYTAKGVVEIQMPVAINVQGIQVQPISSAAVSAVVTETSTESIKFMMTAACEAAVSIHIFGG